MGAKAGKAFWGGQDIELTPEVLQKGFSDLMLVLSAYIGYSIQSGQVEVATNFLAHLKSVESVAFEALSAKKLDTEKVREQVEAFTKKLLAH